MEPNREVAGQSQSELAKAGVGTPVVTSNPQEPLPEGEERDVHHRDVLSPSLLSRACHIMTLGPVFQFECYCHGENFSQRSKVMGPQKEVQSL